MKQQFGEPYNFKPSISGKNKKKETGPKNIKQEESSESQYEA